MEQPGIQAVVVRDITDLTLQLTAGSNSGKRLWLDPVDQEALETPLLYCGPALLKALEKTEEIDYSKLVEQLRDGRAVLVIEWLDNVPQGCFVSTIIDYPLFRAGLIMAIARLPGKQGTYPNRNSLELLRRWFTKLNCSCIEGEASDAVARLWARAGFEEVSRKVRLKI